MATASSERTAYRSTAARRTLILDLAPPRRASVWAILGGLVLGIAGALFLGSTTLDVVHALPAGCTTGDFVEEMPPCTDVVHKKGPILGATLDAALRGGKGSSTTLHFSNGPEIMVLLVLASGLWLFPRLKAERSVLALDEREGRVSIVHDRPGKTERTDRPLEALREAALFRQGGRTQTQLLFKSGEHIDLDATLNEEGQERLVTAVNTFIAPRV